jgi:murein DD-endopeptidase MepM/ murein hydrolase activator NlpD
MPATSSACRAALTAVVVAAVMTPATAGAHERGANGATAAPARPQVASLKCDTGERVSCPSGEFLALRGEGLDTVDTVVFLGERGRGDDLKAPPRRRSPHRVLVQVPDAAPSGPLRARSRVAGASPPSRPLSVTTADVPAPETQADGVFPVRGSYDLGTGTNRFGGGRGHKGQDIFAACGTPIVAALSGEVTTAGYEGRMGHHVVIAADDGTSQAYMHMLGRPTVRRGDRVAAGMSLGAVGESGNAQGCHLHFELWTAPGWYRGGEPIDPLPELRRWLGSD